MNAVAIQPPCEVDDIEHLDATQVIIAARQSSTLAEMCAVDQRERWAQRFEDIIEELHVAVIVMRRAGPPPSTDIPPFIAKGSTIPLTSRAFLRGDADAGFHE
jgi:hypothetical protein